MIKAWVASLEKFHFRSIQATIAAAFSCLILITVIVIAAISFSMTSQSVEKNSREYVSQLIEQVNRNIEAYVDSMENISLTAMYNSDVREYLLAGSLNPRGEEEDRQRIGELFSSILSSRKDISSIMLFGYNGKNVLVSEKANAALNPYVKPEVQPWYLAAQKAGGSSVLSSSHVENVLQESNYRWVVSLSRELKSYGTAKKMGVLNVDLNYSVINDMCSRISLGKRGYVFIIDNEGNIVYHPQQQLIYSNVKNEMIHEVLNAGSNYFVTDEGSSSRIYNIKQSVHTGWKIVGVAYLDELVSNKSFIRNSYFLLGFICLFTAILLSFLISSRISRPIRILESSMRKVENGNFDIQVEVGSSNEIGELSRAFNIMIEKIKELMQQNVKEQELKRKSELKALQAQINPHFLYNTLDSIIWMAEGKKSEEVVKMTSALAKLFRLSISKGEEIITIANEIEHIRNYLTIQKMRYRDKLDFEINVDNDILRYKTLKILLQPLVENSIYHGIKNTEEGGMVKICGYAEGETVILAVTDNGAGMTPEKAASLLQGSDGPENRHHSGVGVRNVNERIKLYFGDKFGLSYESSPGEGTIVYIRLPVIE